MNRHTFKERGVSVCYVCLVGVGGGEGDKATQLFSFLPRFCMVKVHFLQKKCSFRTTSFLLGIEPIWEGFVAKGSKKKTNKKKSTNLFFLVKFDGKRGDLPLP